MHVGEIRYSSVVVTIATEGLEVCAWKVGDYVIDENNHKWRVLSVRWEGGGGLFTNPPAPQDDTVVVTMQPLDLAATIYPGLKLSRLEEL